MAFKEEHINSVTDFIDGLPENLKEKVFEVAEIAKFSKEESISYEDTLKYYSDLKNSLDAARNEGIEQGKLNEKMETVKLSIKNGLDNEMISKITGLKFDEIDKLRNH